MDAGTGLSEKSVRNGIEKAVRHRLIVEDVDDSDRGRVKRSYRPHMLITTNAGSRVVTPTELGGKSYHPGGQDLPARVVQPTTRTKKDTLEKNHEKNMVPTGTQSNDPRTNWKAELAATMTESNYQRWVAPLELLELVNHHAVLSAPDAGTADYARTRLADTLAQALNVEGIEVRAAK